LATRPSSLKPRPATRRRNDRTAAPHRSVAQPDIVRFVKQFFEPLAALPSSEVGRPLAARRAVERDREYFERNPECEERWRQYRIGEAWPHDAPGRLGPPLSRARVIQIVPGVRLRVLYMEGLYREKSRGDFDLLTDLFLGAVPLVDVDEEVRS
jgi:hypothetical protein